MRTHRADCVSERRLRPRRPERHSTTMSQGLPSVDTQSTSHGREPAGVTDRPIDACSGVDEMERQLSPLTVTLTLSSFIFLFVKLPLFQIPSLTSLTLLLSFSQCNPSLSLSASVHQPNGSILSGMGYGQLLLKV